MAPPFPDPSAVHLFSGALSLFDAQGEAEPNLPGRLRALRSERALRSLLSRYTGLAPEKVPLEKNRWGKPLLPDSFSLWFNLSHSENRWIAAVAAFPVGIDLEAHLPRKDPLRFARRFFSPEEAAIVGAAPPEERTAALLRIWTKKEAFLKGCGMGLHRPLRSFWFVRPGRRSPWELVAPPEPSAPPWYVRGWREEDRFFCALAVAHRQPDRLLLAREELFPQAKSQPAGNNPPLSIDGLS
ncbi:4'-phosphopantetheinyl transferase sfp [Methylacidimicrobium cyclopophantes]|uniref:4'-phosphopantetheinyl transferase sfp n=1 Tax=Methylacidimicrobium cyclopophantes TaxID=1041766 RepID=A0A5E6MB87_9BACT|nr:4'-phosphopantetheinyl transferase superfamily protein [Methylacidimicrobium cyclopophantes]VVM05589.1 4'-phosphopantetheinyl transferase sfp [Methylacidimicrobium cyclopophantes]